jgi:hypothetical protein
MENRARVFWLFVVSIAALLLACDLNSGMLALGNATPTLPKPTSTQVIATATAIRTATSTQVVATATAVQTATQVPGKIIAVNAPPAGKYLMVEVWEITSGTGNLPKMMIDFPDYRFDPAAGTLKPFSPNHTIRLAPTDWGFLGDGASRSGAAGGGAVSRLTPITLLPFSGTAPIGTGTVKIEGEIPREETQMVPIILSAASAEGALALRIGVEDIVLGPGMAWKREVEAEAATSKYAGRFRMTTTVTNYGWQERARISDKP